MTFTSIPSTTLDMKTLQRTRVPSFERHTLFQKKTYNVLWESGLYRVVLR